MYDIFNHQNVEFWSTLMVAYNTTNFISCAGTNFAIRVSALRALGKLPKTLKQGKNRKESHCDSYIKLENSALALLEQDLPHFRRTL